MTQPIELSVLRGKKRKGLRFFIDKEKNHYVFAKDRYGSWTMTTGPGFNSALQGNVLYSTEWPLMIIDTTGVHKTDIFLDTLFTRHGYVMDRKAVETQNKNNDETFELTPPSNDSPDDMVHVSIEFFDNMLDICYCTVLNNPDIYAVAICTTRTNELGLAIHEMEADGTTIGNEIPVEEWENWVFEIPDVVQQKTYTLAEKMCSVFTRDTAEISDVRIHCATNQYATPGLST